MARRLLLSALLVVLVGALWLSPELQTISAGVALFLFGMLFLEQGFAAFAGGTLERFLKRSTKSLPRSLTFGVVTTTLMQSSSLVSVITISFLSAGLIGLAQGVGIIFGANIGTTTGAWLMAAFGMKVKISAYAMPMLVIGVLFVLQRSSRAKGAGYILAGFGLIFLGIHFMKEGFEAFQSSFDLARFAVTGFAGLLAYAGIGVAATIVMQSSHATLMLTIAALATQQISYENALAVAIGANIGTTITAILGAISANIEGKRLAAAHLVFNLVTAAVAIAAIDGFRWSVDELSVVLGLAPDDWTLKLALFHTLFNLVGVILMIPFVGVLVRFLEKRVRARDAEAIRPRHLNEAALVVPEASIEVLRNEAQHLFDTAFEVLAHGINVHRHEILSEQPLDKVVEQPMPVMNKDVMADYYRRVKYLYSEIIAFAAQAEKAMNERQREELYHVRIACRLLVKAIKATALMSENINRYGRSDNLDIRHEYNLIRRTLAEILRDIFVLRLTTEDDLVFVMLLRMRRRLAGYERTTSGKIDHLIRHEIVTKAMATSLMNDSGLAHDVGQWLLEIGERLFVPEGSDLETLRDELLVEDDRGEGLDDVLRTGRRRRFAATPVPIAGSLTGEYRRLTGQDDG